VGYCYMKNRLYVRALLVCIAIIPSYFYGKNTQESDWQDRPLFRQAESSQQPEEIQQNKKEKNSLNTSAWYKKPAVKYAAGGILSAAVTVYSLYRYLQVPQISIIENNQEVTLGGNNTATSGTPKQGLDSMPPVQNATTEIRVARKNDTAVQVAAVVVGSVGMAALCAVSYGIVWSVKAILGAIR
jgi:hypothetical protein